MRAIHTLLMAGVIAGLFGCQDDPQTSHIAPGAPGAASTWAYAGKTGVGTAYQRYGETRSKVWFSIAKGAVTETMFGLIHQAQLKQMQLIVHGESILHTETRDMQHQIDYLHKDKLGRPLSLAYRIINRDPQGRYEIEKHVFTDPKHNSLVMRTWFRPQISGLTAYVTLNPHMANTGEGDSAVIQDGKAVAFEADNYLTLDASQSFVKQGVGFVGKSDLLSQLQHTSSPISYTSSGVTPGNVALWAELASTAQHPLDIVLGFGANLEDSQNAARQTLNRGYHAVQAEYLGEGEAIGWWDYLSSLDQLNGIAALSLDNGRLAYTSALVLKALEDKTHPGALIASLSNPWGESVSAAQAKTGYKAVWPRDFYQVAMALLAMGDTQTPKHALAYLNDKIQVKSDTPGNKGASGWFLQKTQVDGTLEWTALQLDQTAMPIMLGWKLAQQGVIDQSQLASYYTQMLKPAADFLARGGKLNFDGNRAEIIPPFTQQERWEEQAGYSPSTIAAVITGLVCAADIAAALKDEKSAKHYLNQASTYSAQLESLTYLPDPGYYVRINPGDSSVLNESNGQPGLAMKQVLDAGFLELVRYGVRNADDKRITSSLNFIDKQQQDPDLQIRYDLNFPDFEQSFAGFRRYGNDGYGEDTTTGHPYGKMTPGQRGRIWPIFTGERGHYEIARGVLSHQQIRSEYVQAMELFANQGMMLPEQVWDGVGNNQHYQYIEGEGTDAATPLAWSHAEYIKLLRSLKDNQVWDAYPQVAQQLKTPVN